MTDVRLAGRARGLHPQGPEDPRGVVNDEVPCKPTCPICTDDSPPEKWNGPYTAYRWSPDAPGGVSRQEEQRR